MKRFISIGLMTALALCLTVLALDIILSRTEFNLTVSAAPVGPTDSGTFDEAGWNWDLVDGVLTITINGGSKTWKKPELVPDYPWGNYKDEITALILPDELTDIGSHAFREYGELRSVTFPSSLLTIGEYAFSLCGWLQTVNLSGTQLTTIEQYAFFNSGLNSLTLLPDTLQTIGQSAFLNCVTLQEVNLSGTQLTTIEDNTFNGAYKLESITFPGYLQEIGHNAFNGCSELGRDGINLSNTKLTSIGYESFSYNAALSSITFPNTLLTIGENAFLGCPNLDDIFIPESVTNFPVYTIPGTGLISNTVDDLIIFGIYDSPAIEWAHTVGYTRWFFQARAESMSENPPEIHQNVPVEFTFNTSIPNNNGMTFSIAPALPAGLTLQTDNTGNHIPGTIYGVVTDPNIIDEYNGKAFKITAHPAGYPSDKYNVTVDFTLTLIPKDYDPTAGSDITGIFGFEQGGRLGGVSGIIEVGTGGNLIAPAIMTLDAPFSKDDEGWEFHEFYINGVLQERGTVKGDPTDGDYYAEAGSTILTIRDQTIAALGDGYYTATATIRRVDSDSSISLSNWKANEAGKWDSKIEVISQNFIKVTTGSPLPPPPVTTTTPPPSTPPTSTTTPPPTTPAPNYSTPAPTSRPPTATSPSRPTTSSTTPIMVQRGISTLIVDIPLLRIQEIAKNLPIFQIRADEAGIQTIIASSDNAGQNAVLMRYNAETEQFEVVSATTVNTDGTAAINIPAAGDYIVVIAQTGDLTGTGTVTEEDAFLLLQALAGKTELNPLQQFLTSSRSDSKFTATDALNILKLVAGIMGEI